MREKFLMSTLIEFKDVVKEYKSGDHVLRAMDNVNFTIDEGEFVVILGPSGAGKSTLLKSIFGELKPIEGAVFVEDQDIRSISLKELSKKMSIVNTDRVKPEHMSAWDVVISGRLPYSDGFGMFSDGDRKAAAEALVGRPLSA